MKTFPVFNEASGHETYTAVKNPSTLF